MAWRDKQGRHVRVRDRKRRDNAANDESVPALALTALMTTFIVIDGESTWLEGLALVGLYVILAASVWWGAPIGG